MRRSLLPLFLLASASAGVGAPPVHALSGNGDPQLPSDLGVLYGALDRTDLGQHRELYASANALAAVRAGKPLPPGTELTMIVYAIARDAGGTPVADAGGRLIKQAPLGYLFMRKRGAEAAHPFGGTAGAWQFQVFGPDKRVVRGAKLADCAACHEKRREQDFVYSDERLKAFAGRPSAH